jgi:tetratricopeptide (TPR) repeat protein
LITKYIHTTTILITLLLSVVNIGFCQEKIAVLVANSNYLVGGKLKNPKNDINELKKAFDKNGYHTIVFNDLSLEDFNGKLMDSIRKAIKDNYKQPKLFFHYAGHGLQVDNENYFVPVDFPKIEYKSDVKRKCFSLNSLFEVLSEITEFKTEVKGLISIDACRINPFLVEGVTSGLSKPPSNTQVYNHFGILYAVGINQTASDGAENLSPYVKGILKSIGNCEDFQAIRNRIVAEYILEGIEKEPYFEGSLNFSFCLEKESKNILSTDWTEEYHSILSLITIDFQEGKYKNLLQKADLINRIIQSNRIQIDKSSIQYLQFEQFVAIAQFKLGDYNNAIPSLVKLAKSTLNKDKFEIFSDVYFYLARFYTLENRWDELSILRKNYLDYLLSNEKYFDAAITYDKIAGDFEHRSLQDSAKIFYKKATDLFEKIEIITPEDKHYASLIYGNYGKCYAYGHDVNYEFSINLIERALLYSEGNTELKLSNLSDLIGIQLILDSTTALKKKISKNLFDHYELCKSSNEVFNNVYHWDLAVTFFSKYNISDSLKKAFEELNSILISQNPVKIEEDNILLRNLNNTCSVNSRQITIEAPSGILPILYFDKNNNLKFDDRDYKIIPESAEIDTVIATEFGSNSTEQWVIYNNVTMAKNAGIFNLLHNNSHLNSLSSKFSFCIVYPKGDKTIWNFRIDCSELDICKSNYFVGLKNTMIHQDGQLLMSDNIFRFVPMSTLNNDNLKYSMSTLK